MICYPSNKVCFPMAKIKKYLLLPGSKHYREFQDVGYHPSDDFKLFKDIESQFDKKRAEGYRYDVNSISYSIIMQLGLNTKAPFLTAWTEDALAPLPRFVTAHRVKKECSAMFEEFDHVKINSANVTGIIVDKAVIEGITRYIVESDSFNENAPHGGEWPLYHCDESDLSPLDEKVAIPS